jgi:hypothetical protein
VCHRRRPGGRFIRTRAAAAPAAARRRLDAGLGIPRPEPRLRASHTHDLPSAIRRPNSRAPRSKRRVQLSRARGLSCFPALGRHCEEEPDLSIIYDGGLPRALGCKICPFPAQTCSTLSYSHGTQEFIWAEMTTAIFNARARGGPAEGGPARRPALAAAPYPNGSHNIVVCDTCQAPAYALLCLGRCNSCGPHRRGSSTKGASTRLPSRRPTRQCDTASTTHSC